MDGTSQSSVRGTRGLLAAILLSVVVFGALLVLPWLGIGYCVFVGSSLCPAILSPQTAQGPRDVAPGAEPAQSPRVTDAADRFPAAPDVPLPTQTAGNRPTANPKYVALVIGITHYPGENRLKNPGRDATAIAETLKDLNYTVVGGQALLDVNRKQMVEALADFGQRAASATVAIVYYAGHGIQIDELEPIYLIPIDAELKKKNLLPDEGVALSRVLKILPDGPDQYGLVILDACRTSKYPLEGLQRGTRGTGLRGLKAVKAPNRAFVAYSASAGEEAADGEGAANSPYATVLLKRMKDKDAPDIKTVFARVQDDFRGTGAQQNPGHDDRLGDVKVRLAASQRLPPVGAKFQDCKDCPEMVVLPADTFMMGAPKGEDGSDDIERPQHPVRIKSFAIGIHEVTFAEWDICVAEGGCSPRLSDAGWGRGDRPVIEVSWDDAQNYVKWLSTRTYSTYRLPTEAEWEYAARAGTKTAYPWGNKASHDYANYGKEEGTGGFAQGRDKWKDQTAPVAQFPPNNFGLFDMHGNVVEWVEDCWNDSYKGAPSDGRAWTAVDDCSRRVFRGGSWFFSPRSLRSASRSWETSSARFGYYYGFRVARAD